MRIQYFVFVLIAGILLIACQPTAESTPVANTPTTSSTPVEPTEPLSTTIPGPTEVPDMMVVQVGKKFTLGVGDMVIFQGNLFSFTFNEVLEDSRCPTNVQCVEAGQARISITVQEQTKSPVVYELNTNPPLDQDHVVFLDYDIQLVDLTPYPADPGQEIPASDYQASFVVTSLSMTTPTTPEATSAAAQTVQLNTPFTLGVGATAVLDNSDLTLRFDSVVEDSRCPKDVECFWAGQVILAITVRQTEYQISPDSPTTPKEVIVGNYIIEVTAVDPHPQTTTPITPETYRATFVIRGS